MIYDTFGVEGICRGCGGITNYYINGDYPVCPKCLKILVGDYEALIRR